MCPTGRGGRRGPRGRAAGEARPPPRPAPSAPCRGPGASGATPWTRHTARRVPRRAGQLLIKLYFSAPITMLQFDHIQRARQALLKLASGAVSPRVPLYAVLAARRARHAAALRKRRRLSLSGTRAGGGS